MGVRTEKSGDTLIVRLNGEFDVAFAPRFREVVSAAFADDQGLHHLILCLKEVTFIDSTGLAAIIGRYKDVTSTGGNMRMAGARPSTLKLLSLSGIDRLIPQDVDLETSIRKIRHALGTPEDEGGFERVR